MHGILLLGGFLEPMSQVTETQILDFIRSEVESGLPSDLSLQTDLATEVDWSQVHQDERLDFFLFIFCRRFKITHEDWNAYPSSEGGILKKIGGWLTKGGPPADYFSQQDIVELPVSSLLRIAKERRWYL